MNFIRNFTILLAGAILLLHTVLPHEHHSELNEVEHVAQHESAKGLLDFIKMAFHMDQGEGRLEKYQVSGINFLFPAILAEKLSVIFQPVVLFEKSFPISLSEEHFHSRFLSSHLRFRGPPHLA